jgi:hypothetical protein
MLVVGGTGNARRHGRIRGEVLNQIGVDPRSNKHAANRHQGFERDPYQLCRAVGALRRESSVEIETV